MRTTKGSTRKILSEAERALLSKETERGHMDPLTELGFALKVKIPKGQDFTDWIADERECGVVIAALLSRGFDWEEIRRALFDLTHWRWLPSVEQLQRNFAYLQARKEKVA